MSYAPVTRLTVDLDALAHNHALLRKEARGAEVAPAVKADAYGLGAGPVATRLWAEGARAFFVARLHEGEALRAALGARDAVVYVLDGVPSGAAPRLAAAGLTPVLNSLPQIDEWLAFCAGGPRLPAALHVDTGMNRLGLRIEETEALVASRRLDEARIELVMSHLACATDPLSAMNGRQVQAFKAVERLFPDARASLANSGGVFLGEDFLFDMVRPGICLYGGGPFGRPDARLRAVARLEAQILQVRAVPPGEAVGYGGLHRAQTGMRIATLAAGYADGVLRAASPGARGWFAGARRPLLGRMSMDLMAIDVTGCDEARPGEMVELLGPEVPLDEISTAAGTAAYETLVRLSPRAERIYVGAAG